METREMGDEGEESRCMTERERDGMGGWGEEEADMLEGEGREIFAVCS